MRSMLRRLVILAVLAAITVAVAAGTASADKPIRGCPQNYALIPVDQSDPVQVAVNKNGDQQICVKDTPVGDGTGTGNSGSNWVDNTSNSQGG
jgi:hypothetical protein